VNGFFKMLLNTVGIRILTLPPSLNNDTTQQHAATEFLANDDSDLDEFYEALSQTGTKPAILSLIPKYSDKYIPEFSSWFSQGFAATSSD